MLENYTAKNMLACNKAMMGPFVFVSSFREDEDASHCAVPISTSLIKQIMNKAGHEDSIEDILSDFYGPKTSSDPPWPYVSKDTTR